MNNEQLVNYLIENFINKGKSEESIMDSITFHCKNEIDSDERELRVLALLFEKLLTFKN